MTTYSSRLSRFVAKRGGVRSRCVTLTCSLIGGVVLHRGRIAEMRTGEGRPLVATLPIYLNALDGKGVHLVTVNDYLARRDAEWMGRIYNFLGLSIGVVRQWPVRSREVQVLSL